MRARLDHLVVAAESLGTTAVLVERFLGVPLALGGKHERMGTHNRLLRLGSDAYLELLAVDPIPAPRPARPRWYGLDGEAQRTALRTGPRLIHWVVRVDGTEAAPDLGFDLGRWEHFQRGDLSWRLTVRADGTLEAEGMVPSLIVWDGAAHPSERLPDVGCTLESLELSHPMAEEVQGALNRLGLPHRCAPGAALLTAEIRTPAGLRVLRSNESLR